MPIPHVSEEKFTFKQGPDVFSPKELIELARPGAGVANPAGDLAFVSLSKYSFKERKCVIAFNVMIL